MNNTTLRDDVLANHIAVNVINAPLVELVDTPDLGSGAHKACKFESYREYKNTKIIKIFLV